MHVIAAEAEVQRTTEIRRQAELLAQLPSMFYRLIFGDETITTAELRVAEHAIGRNLATLIAAAYAGAG